VDVVLSDSLWVLGGLEVAVGLFVSLGLLGPSRPTGLPAEFLPAAGVTFLSALFICDDAVAACITELRPLSRPEGFR